MAKAIIGTAIFFGAYLACILCFDQQRHDLHALDANFWLTTQHEAQPGASCSSYIYQESKSDWKDASFMHCSPSSLPETSENGHNFTTSSINCFVDSFSKQTACMSRNLVIDSSRAMSDSKRHKLLRFLLADTHSAVKAACKADEQHSQEMESPSLTPFFKKAFEAGTSNAHETVGAACSDPAKTVNHPVLFLYRSDTTGMYHHWEDAAHLMMSLALLPELQQEVIKHGMQVVIIDGKWKGRYTGFWQSISAPYPLRYLREEPFPDGTCFRIALHAAHVHGRALYSRDPGTLMTCPSPVMAATSRLMRYAYQHLLPLGSQRRLTPQPPAAPADPRDVPYAASDKRGVHMNVIWVSRKTFDAVHLSELAPHQSVRVLGSEEDDIIQGLQQAVLQWNSRSCLLQATHHGGGQQECRRSRLLYDLVVLEGNDVSFEDQVHVSSRAAVIIGVHGAGLTHMLFMPPGCRAVLELHKGSAANKHHHNLAHMIGALYSTMHWAGKASVGDVSGRLTELLQQLDAAEPACMDAMGL